MCFRKSKMTCSLKREGVLHKSNDGVSHDNHYSIQHGFFSFLREFYVVHNRLSPTIFVCVWDAFSNKKASNIQPCMHEVL